MMMAAIKKSELQKMSAKELEMKIIDFEKAILELRGEGKPDKARPLKKAIARMKTRLSQEDLNTINAEVSNMDKGKVNEQK